MTGELLQRYLNGVTTSAENKEVLDWAEKDAANRNDLKILRKIYDALLCNSNSFVPTDSEPDISDMQKLSQVFNIEDSAQISGTIVWD
jgi:hypothetical protein